MKRVKSVWKPFVARVDESAVVEPNVIFIAADSEGVVDRREINEYVVAKLYARDLLLPSGGAQIETWNYGLKKHRHRKFLFGETTKTMLDLLTQLIIEYFTGIYKEDAAKKFVLVVHGPGDLPILDDLGVAIETLGITGVVDTLTLSQTVLEGKHGSLGSLLEELEVPTRYKSLHCAGNDTNFTMRLLLASLEHRYGDRSGRMSEIAMQALPTPPCRDAVKDPNEDWEKCLEDAGIMGLME